MNPIRVLIVDDHAMVRKGMVAFLKNEPELELIGEACCMNVIPAASIH